jgi:hypothetical protein
MFDLKYEINIRIENLWFWFVWKLPKKLIYFSAIRLMSYATTGKNENIEVGKITMIDALKRWEECQKH